MKQQPGFHVCFHGTISVDESAGTPLRHTVISRKDPQELCFQVVCCFEPGLEFFVQWFQLKRIHTFFNIFF